MLSFYDSLCSGNKRKHKDEDLKLLAEVLDWIDERSAERDGNARQREFQIGFLVLVLSPTSAGALTAQWKRPYPVLQKIGALNYIVDMHGSRKWEGARFT